jgi:hypothetical protein
MRYVACETNLASRLFAESVGTILNFLLTFRSLLPISRELQSHRALPDLILMQQTHHGNVKNQLRFLKWSPTRFSLADEGPPVV